jgi:hypothetical protein
VAAKVEYPELEPASMNVEKGLNLSESTVLAPTSTRAVITPSMTTETAGAADPNETHSVHQDEVKENNTVIKSNRHVEIPENIISNATSKASIDEVKNTELKDIIDSGPSTELSTPNNIEISAQDNQSSDPDDGMWETVEVKPRGRRRKGGSKKSSSGSQNNGIASNNSTSNNSNGRNQSNNDNASAHHDGGSSHNGRRRHGKRGRDKNRNNTEQQQQNNMIKDVILQILDAVDDEVMRIGIDGANLLYNSTPVGDNERNNSSAKNGHHSSSAVNSKQSAQQQHISEEQRRKRSNGFAASSKTLPTPSLASNLSAKSLRDVLVGSSPPTATNFVPQINHSSLQSSANNLALCTAKEEGANPQPSNGSSKVKPGMSYKSVIEPHATVNPKESHPPKPKANAWAKPPSDTKAKLDVELKTKAEAVLAAVKPLSYKPAVKPLSYKPDQSSGLIALEGSTPSSDRGKKKETNIPVPVDTEKAQQRTSASVTDDEGTPPPLSTLVGPGNLCSASSSVASSLEAPHSSSNRFCHQYSSATTGDDVGYHLLNVCGRLSEEITTFMSRRALALDVRRKERDAVLGALGDTLAVRVLSRFINIFG